jgi:hypothetical protein
VLLLRKLIFKIFLLQVPSNADGRGPAGVFLRLQAADREQGGGKKQYFMAKAHPCLIAETGSKASEEPERTLAVTGAYTSAHEGLSSGNTNPHCKALW